MPNPIKGEVPLKLDDGREFVLVLDMEALVEAEAAYGRPLARMMADAQLGFVGAIRAMLFGALRYKHPETTLRDASTLFAEHPDAISDALEAATEAAMPTSEGKEGANPPPVGKNSGPSGAKPARNPKPSGGQRRKASN
jgi:hypothetical protein